MDNLKEWHGCLLVNSELVNIRDLLDFELGEDGVTFGLFRSKTLFGEMEKWTKATNWIVIQPLDNSWWKVAVIKWGQIDFIHCNWFQNTQFMN